MAMPAEPVVFDDDEDVVPRQEFPRYMGIRMSSVDTEIRENRLSVFRTHRRVFALKRDLRQWRRQHQQGVQLTLLPSATVPVEDVELPRGEPEAKRRRGRPTRAEAMKKDEELKDRYLGFLKFTKGDFVMAEKMFRAESERVARLMAHDTAFRDAVTKYVKRQKA